MKAVLLLISALLCSCSSGYKSNFDYALMPVKQGKKWGYVNAKGEYVINPQFDQAALFADGLARVNIDGKYGFINKNGKYVINPSYNDATSFYEGRAWVISPKGAPTLIDTNGKTIFVLKEARKVYNYSDGLALAVNDDGKVWGIDMKGKTVFNLTKGVYMATNFMDGFAVVLDSNLKYGFIDKNGRVVIDCQFDDADIFHNGKAVVKNSKMYGIINLKGQYIVNPQFDDMQWDNDRFVIKLGDMCGWCDARGKVVINPQFVTAYPFMEGNLGAVSIGKNFGYIDVTGKIVINPQFELALPFADNGVAWVKMAGKWGLIDNEGRYVANPQFDDVLRLNNEPKMDYVFSEYFNIEGIVSMITSMLDDNKFDGMTITQTSISSFRKKYGLGERHNVFEKNYSPDMNYRIIANGTFTRTVSDGWWGTTTQQIPEAKIDYISLLLELKDSDNVKPLYDALTKAFGGSKGKRRSGQYIRMQVDGGFINIYISDKPLDASRNIVMNYDD